jgi:hypothetical protein
MAEFEDGQRVRFVGVEGLGSKWKGRVGVVTETYRATEEVFINVKFEGEVGPVSFYPEDFEPFREKYEIENAAEDSTSAVLELTDTEAALLKRVIEALNTGKPTYAPTLGMEKHVETRRGRRTDA